MKINKIIQEYQNKGYAKLGSLISKKDALELSQRAFTLCLMDSKIKNIKTGKKYPKIFGRNSLTIDYVKKLKSVPKQVYL